MKYHSKSTRKYSGMTLAEVVIAIAIIAFTIPLILSSTSSAYRSRQAAEADTRSAWLVRDAQRRIAMKWSKAKLVFPSNNISNAKTEFIYSHDGTFIAENEPAKKFQNAAYLVSVKADPYYPKHDSIASESLALITVEIQNPAKAVAGKSTNLIYKYLSAGEGDL